MNERKFAARLLATTALTLGLGGGAMAQTSVGEVIVTARRMEERLQDVPISISVFNQEQLTKQNVSTAADLAKYTPSLATNTRFGPDKASFIIRGFTQETNTSPSVGVYFADVVAPRNLAFTTGGNGMGPGALFDLENVQVLKGPQGTLFGRNTTGGAVLLVPRKPTGEFEGYAEVSTGNYGMWRFQGVLNAPINEQLRLRAGVDQMTRKGYSFNHSGVGPRRLNDVDYLAGRVSLVWDVAPNLENYTIFTFGRSDTNGNTTHLIACQPDPRRRGGVAIFMADAACAQIARQQARGDNFYDVEDTVPNPISFTKQWQVINTTTWQASKALTVRNIASYSEFREQYRNNASGDNLILPSTINLVRGGVVTPVPTGAFAGTPYNFVLLYPYPGKYTSAQRSFTEELQVRGLAFDERLNWQAGAYMEMSQPLEVTGQITTTLLSCTDVANFRCTDFLSAVASAPAGVGSANTRVAWNFFSNYGVYAQGTYKLTDQLSVTAGARYTWDSHKQKGGQLSYFFSPARGLPPGAILNQCSNTVRIPGPRVTNDVFNCVVAFEAKSDKPTWMVDLEYRPMDNVMLWAKYARGYRQGLANAFAPGFEILGPEKVDSYELGVKTSFGGRMPGYLNVVGFYNELQNQQIQASAVARAGSGVSSTNSVINAGKSELKGVEVDAAITPFEGFTLTAAYTYLDTELKSISVPDLSTHPLFASFSVTAAVGLPLVLSPKHRYVLDASYTLPLSEEIGQVSIGATYSHSDKQITQATSPFGVLPAQDLLNLNLTWSSVGGGPIDVALFATNVTKEEFPTFVVGAFNSTGFEHAIPVEPRMYGVRVRYRFGD